MADTLTRKALLDDRFESLSATLLISSYPRPFVRKFINPRWRTLVMQRFAVSKLQAEAENGFSQSGSILLFDIRTTKDTSRGDFLRGGAGGRIRS